MRNIAVHTPNQYVFIKPSSQDSGIYAEEEMEGYEVLEVRNDSKEAVSSRYNRTEAHANSERLAAHTGPALVQAWGGGEVDMVPICNQEVITIGTHLQRKKLVFSNKVSLD